MSMELHDAATPLAWSAEQLEILRQQVCAGASDDELAFFAQVCAHKQLDPFLGEIVGIMRWDAKAGREVMKIQETVEGLRTIAERSGLYGGFRGPQWSADGHTWVDVWLDETKPPAAARYWVIRKDWVEPAPGVARWASNVQMYKDRQGTMQLAPLWRDRPDEMLGKCAEVRALKRAFTKEFARAGISVRDLSDAQIVTMEARDAGFDDDARHALVAEITDGRTQSTTELTDPEILEARQEIAKRSGPPDDTQPQPVRPARGPAPSATGATAARGASRPAARTTRLELSPQCSSSQHATCPGYYKMAITCECPCHPKAGQPPQTEPEQPDAVQRTIARGAGTLEARLELLGEDDKETIRYWIRQQGWKGHVGSMTPDQRKAIAAELDARGLASGYDLEPEDRTDPDDDEVVPGDVIEPGMFDDENEP